MREKTSDYTWLRYYLEKITNIANNIKNGGPANEYGCYSALKLISVYYCSEIFSKVARHPNRKLEGYDGAVYVDLFAGSGLVKLTDTDDIVAGSAPCAVSNKYGFDYCVCVELNEERKKSLEKRLESLLPMERFKVIQGDCNDCISDVVSLLKKKFNKPILLTFVDPEGMEIKWSTLKALSDEFSRCDFIVNVGSSSTVRVKGKLEKGISNVERIFEDYWGEDAELVLSELAEGKSPEKKYQENVNKVLGKTVGENIAIRDQGKKIAYYILLYTRMTRGGSEYANGFATLKRRIEYANRDTVKNILDQIHNRSATIEHYSN